MSQNFIKVCIERRLPEELRVAAAQRAIEENPANLPILPQRRELGPPDPVEMALETRTLWRPGRTLRVRFLGGTPQIQAKVQRYAEQWSRYANITLAFGNDPAAEIRVAFDPGGSWSYIGTDALSISQHEPTMNFGWLRATTPDEEYSRVVLHEFGHALSCIHEHQSPAATIPWDREAVYDYYMGPPNNWTRDEVNANIFQKYRATQTQFSAFDRESIMLYAIPDELTIGGYSVGWNRVLSATDKQFIATQYPRLPEAITTLEVGAEPLAASIGAHGEEDMFQFNAVDSGRYVVETGGPTDVAMALLGPNSQSRLIAQDDDSGQGFNARIAQALTTGSYYVRVRHWRPSGTGLYTVAVRREP